MNRYIQIAIMATVLVLFLGAIKSISATDLDTMGTFCTMADTNMTVKNELVDNNIVDKKYSNVTCGQIDNLVQSGQVDIDQVLGFNNLKHYFELKQEQNAENLLLGTQNETSP
jgi:hypothetical protein